MLSFFKPEDSLAKMLKEIDWFEIEKLSKEHELSAFDCGTNPDDMELTSFLKENALLQQNQNINLTYVVVLKGTKTVIGYVTTLADRLRVSAKEKGKMNLPNDYADFPAIKVGRLAVHTQYCHKTVGTTLLMYVRGLAINISDNVGCRFLIVDSYPKSVSFYLERGFVHNLIQDQKRMKIIKQKPDGTEVIGKVQRDTVSLRYDLLNPPKQA